MKSGIKNILSVTVFLAFGSFVFAGVKKSDCSSIDWQKKGYEDGVKGEKINKLYKYTKTCDSAEVPFSADDYRVGRNEGLELFCSNRNAYELGLKNKTKSKKVCIKSIFPDFADYFEKGRSFVKLEKQQRKLAKKVKKYKKYVEKLEKAQIELTNLDTEVENAEFKTEMEATSINRSAAFMKARVKEKFVIKNDIANSQDISEIGSLSLGEEELEVKAKEPSLLDDGDVESYEIEELEIEFKDEQSEHIKTN